MLKWSYLGFILLTMILYVLPRYWANAWDMKYDWFLMLIPPLAFICWTMLQKATAFDALGLGLEDPARSVIAIFMAVVLGILASNLGYKAKMRSTE